MTDAGYSGCRGAQKAEKSIALALQARGLTRPQIATKLGVDHRTVGRWLGHFGTAPEAKGEVR